MTSTRGLCRPTELLTGNGIPILMFESAVLTFICHHLGQWWQRRQHRLSQHLLQFHWNQHWLCPWRQHRNIINNNLFLQNKWFDQKNLGYDVIVTHTCNVELYFWSDGVKSKRLVKVWSNQKKISVKGKELFTSMFTNTNHKWQGCFY